MSEDEARRKQEEALASLRAGRCPLCDTPFRDNTYRCDHEAGWYREWLDLLALHVPPKPPKPVPMSKSKLLALLTDIHNLVVENDSFGGHLEYDVLEAPEGVDFMVRAGYRIGNSQGQGGFRLIEDRSS